MLVLVIIQTVVSIFLITAILLQARGTGLGTAFAQIGDSYHSKRGVEKFLFVLTIVLACLFLIISTINAFL